MSENHVMPAFVFIRKRQVEIETGLTLAGVVIVDLPKGKKPKRCDEEMITSILQKIVAQARSGCLPDDAMMFGWHGGTRPTNADEITDNHELMSSWAKTRMTIELRVSPHEDYLPIGPTDLRQMFLH